jgi:outer membrane protein assembly factor BamB
MTSRLRFCCWFPAALVGAIFALALNIACSGPAADPGAAAGREWPMFGGAPQRNMVNLVEKNLPTDFSLKEGELKGVKWTAQLGSNAYGGPVIAGGKVYVGTNNDKPRDPKIEDDKGVLMCFNEADGKFLWQIVHDKLPNPSENDFPQVGVISTPVVEGRRLYYVSNRAEVICADTDGPRDGKNGSNIVWRYDMLKELDVYPCQATSCSPLVAGDLVFVVTGNGTNSERKLPSPKAPSFIAVNKSTGKLAWKDSSPGDKVSEGQWGNPAYAEVNGKGQVIFPGGDGWLYGFEAATGKPLWKFDCNPKKADEKAGRAGEPNYLVATPVVYDNKVIIGVGRNPEGGTGGVGHLWCIDITKTGDLSPVDDNYDPKADVNKNSGLVWHFGGSTGKKTGRKAYFYRTIGGCAVHEGLVYAADLDGFLYCLDFKTGQKYWEHDLKGTVWAAPYYVDGKIYLGDESGDLFIFPAGKEKKEKDIHPPIDVGRPVKSTVVAANGVLYVQTDSVLFAIAGK